MLTFRFTSREQAAVAEWESSNLTLHTMRDHPEHQVEIMGGMWGAKMSLGHRELFNNVTQLMIDDVRSKPGIIASKYCSPGSSYWVVQRGGPGGAGKMALATGNIVQDTRLEHCLKEFNIPPTLGHRNIIAYLTTTAGCNFLQCRMQNLERFHIKTDTVHITFSFTNFINHSAICRTIEFSHMHICAERSSALIPFLGKL